VARDRLDGGQHLLVREIVGGAGEPGVLAVQKQGDPAVGVPPQGGEQLAAFGFGERSEVHGTILQGMRANTDIGS
jgi:hypothetical protein